MYYLLAGVGQEAGCVCTPCFWLRVLPKPAVRMWASVAVTSGLSWGRSPPGSLGGLLSRHRSLLALGQSLLTEWWLALISSLGERFQVEEEGEEGRERDLLKPEEFYNLIWKWHFIIRLCCLWEPVRKGNGKSLVQRPGGARVLLTEFSFLWFVSLSWVVMVIFICYVILSRERWTFLIISRNCTANFLYYTKLGLNANKSTCNLCTKLLKSHNCML